MAEIASPPAEFKACANCGHQWKSRKGFLEDPRIVPIGYQAVLDRLLDGLFLFNHDCLSTLAVRVRSFADLYEGPIYRRRLTGEPDCPGYCLNKTSLAPCPNECECAFVREILQIVRNWPKG